MLKEGFRVAVSLPLQALQDVAHSWSNVLLLEHGHVFVVRNAGDVARQVLGDSLNKVGISYPSHLPKLVHELPDVIRLNGREDLLKFPILKLAPRVGIEGSEEV